MGNKTPNLQKPSLKININIHSTSALAVPTDSHKIASPSATSTITARLSSRNTPLPDSPMQTQHPALSAFDSFPDTTPLQSHEAKNTGNISEINNGVTGIHISYKISKIAVLFWKKHVQNTQEKQRLELACSIFFGALNIQKEIKSIMVKNATKTSANIREISLKYFNMIEWLMEHLVSPDVDLYVLLTNLGTMHSKMKVKIDHFGSMLQSIHDTLSYYFPTNYNIEVKYAMDEIFTVCAQIMSGQNLECAPHLNTISKSFGNENKVEFIQNLNTCLKSSTGRNYLYKYLRQTFCDEIVVFLKLINKFRNQVSSVQRFMVARDIVRTSVDADANFTLNISHDCREETLSAMEELERKYNNRESMNVDENLFEEVEVEIYKLILDNHWTLFRYNIKTLHSKSFGL